LQLKNTIAWPLVLLVLIVLLPCLVMIWMIQRDVVNERLAQKQRIFQLKTRSLEESCMQLNKFWTKINRDVAKILSSKDALLNSETVANAGLADSVILFNSNAMPLLSKAHDLPLEEKKRKEYSKPWKRWGDFSKFAKNYQKLDRMTKNLLSDDFRDVSDEDGRFLQPYVLLTWLKLARDRKKLDRELWRSRFNDLCQLTQTDMRIPLSQRVFLKSEIREMDADASFPNLKAERLILNYLEHSEKIIVKPGLHFSPVPGVLQYYQLGTDYVLLYREENIFKRLHSILSLRVVDGFKLQLTDRKSNALGRNIGEVMSGWRVEIKDDQARNVLQSSDSFSQIYFALLVCFILGAGFYVGREVYSTITLAQLKNNLVATVSHELKTPLASSRLLLETIMDNPDLPEEKKSEYLLRITLENRHLCDLVERFLAFSSMERNRYQYHLEKVPVKKILHMLNSEIDLKFTDYRKRLQISCISGEQYVFVDINAICLLLCNLIENALKYSPGGTPVEVIIEQDLKGISFAVVDKGIGIKKGDLKRIFNRFYQIDHYLSRKYSGCGLGLSIVKYVIKAHKIKIDVTSKPGQGSAFRFVLPECS